MTMKWKHLYWFFALSILLLALVPILHLTTGASMDFDAVGAKASEETGLVWTSNLLVVIRLCFFKMTWMTPKVTEVCIGMEINCYVSAEL